MSPEALALMFGAVGAAAGAAAVLFTVSRSKTTDREQLLAELRAQGDRLVRIETLLGERDRGAQERRRAWLAASAAEALGIAEKVACAALREHVAGYHGRGAGGGTNPGIPIYQGPISGDAP